MITKTTVTLAVEAEVQEIVEAGLEAWIEIEDQEARGIEGLEAGAQEIGEEVGAEALSAGGQETNTGRGPEIGTETAETIETEAGTGNEEVGLEAQDTEGLEALEIGAGIEGLGLEVPETGNEAEAQETDEALERGPEVPHLTHGRRGLEALHLLPQPKPIPQGTSVHILKLITKQ